MRGIVPALPKPPLKAFLVQVRGKPGPRWKSDPGEGVAGFFRLLGITVSDEAQLVAQATAELLRDGALFDRVEDVWVPDFEGDDSDIADIVGDPSVPGTWYTSGYAAFSEDDDNDD
jgi:hypothetical protein